MNIKKSFLFTFIAFITLFSCTSTEQETVIEDKDYTQFVDPFIGTAFTGHTFPGATYPLGLMQPGPETGNFSWEIGRASCRERV